MTVDAALRLIYELATGDLQSPVKVDSDRHLPEPLLLSGVQQPVERMVRLAAAVVDDPLEFDAAVAIILLADGPFSLRLADGETQLTGLRAFVVWGNANDAAAASTSVLLSNPSDTAVTVRVLVLEEVV